MAPVWVVSWTSAMATPYCRAVSTASRAAFIMAAGPAERAALTVKAVGPSVFTCGCARGSSSPLSM
jgi:hypothetical protein